MLPEKKAVGVTCCRKSPPNHLLKLLPMWRLVMTHVSRGKSFLISFLKIMWMGVSGILKSVLTNTMNSFFGGINLIEFQKIPLSHGTSILWVHMHTEPSRISTRPCWLVPHVSFVWSLTWNFPIAGQLWGGWAGPQLPVSQLCSLWMIFGGVLQGSGNS